MRGRRALAAFVAVLSTVFVFGTAGAATNVTFIYAGAADPTYLDPAIVSDGESFRIARQIFDTLVELKPGTTVLQPGLAKRWRHSRNGKVWTFTLRKGVKFHDGTAFNAAAVCANFNRWFNWSGPFQDASASYYWRQIFAGFKKNEATGLSKSLFKSCRAAGRYVAVIALNRRSGPFIPSLVLPAFAMQSPTAMAKYGANEGQLASGTFRPTGTYAFSHPTGTGPYKFTSWTVGQRVVLDRFSGYWRKKPPIARIIVRPISNNTARLQALQTGEINGYDLVAPQDMPTIRNNSKLRLINRPPFNVAYVTINQAKPPMNNILVRRAVAYGLDRSGVVRSFYAGRAVVANEFMPPAVPGYEPKVTKYPFNPDKAKQLLRQAGLSLPVKIDFYWPTNVSRPYMPSPNLNAAAFKASLERSGFDVNLVSEPWRPDYVKHVNEGSGGHLNIIGWTGDYADADNFVGTFFQSDNPQFGLKGTGAHATIKKLLNRAEAEVNAAKRIKLYKQINKLIATYVPAVPYAHSRPGVGVERRVSGYKASPVGTESFYGVNVGGQ